MVEPGELPRQGWSHKRPSAGLPGAPVTEGTKTTSGLSSTRLKSLFLSSGSAGPETPHRVRSQEGTSNEQCQRHLGGQR